jgi:RHS repeat-associated protein
VWRPASSGLNGRETRTSVGRSGHGCDRKTVGRVVDTETGLICLRARYYDPATAQFLTRDLLVDLTRSAYGYVDDNPLNDTDPLGLSKCGQWSLGGLIDCGAKGGNAAGSAVLSGTKEAVHLGIDAITDPEYLAYWGTLDLNGAIHQGLGWAFGSVGCDLANVIGAPLLPIQAEGLGVDAGGDWLKEHVLGIPNYTVGDEGISNAYLFGSQVGPILQKLGIDWRHNFPGIHQNGSIDWSW